jgi:Tfp pilus assembly pilus retraction ATPase PilT
VLKNVSVVNAECVICCSLALLSEERFSIGKSSGKRDYRRIEGNLAYFMVETRGGRVHNSIRKNAVHNKPSAEERDEYGIQTMDQHLIQLCRDELITLDEAKRISRSKDLARKLVFS